MMHRKMLSVFFILFTSVFFVFAEDSEWYWNQPISKIDFVGLKNVKKSELSGLTSSYIGTLFTEDTYNDIIDRLYALDYFEDVSPYAKHDGKSENNVLLVFEVVEHPVIKEINLVGNTRIRNGELREQIKLKTSDVYVESKVLVDERIIRNYYMSKGYTTSKVSHTVEKTEDGMIINFNINEGANTVIKEIAFSGNTIVSSRTLKSKLELKEIGFMRNGAYQPTTLEKDKQTVITYYREKGYADANVLDVKIESAFNESKSRNDLTLTFIIQEGFQYTYTGMTITGNEVFTTEELLPNAKLKVGSTYNETKFQEDLNTIQSVYYENGYMSNGFDITPIKDSDRHEISFNVTIKESSRSHIENIIIKGNSKTKDYVIRREIPIEPGDVFSREKIYTAMRSLLNLQYFSNVIPEPQQGSEANLVDLVWNVEEQSTKMLQFGMTFSGVTDPNQLPISLFFKIQDSNIFGEGKSISASLSLSNSEQSIGFNYGQNWIGNLPISLSQSLSISHESATSLVNFWAPDLTLYQNGYYYNYNGLSASLGTGLSRRFVYDYAILSLSAGLSNSLNNNIYDENLYVPVDTGVSTYANRWGITNYIYTGVSVDNRDVSYYPTKGWFTSQNFTWYGLIPGLEKEFFLRTDTKLEGYLKLMDIPFTDDYSLKLILSGYSGISVLFPTASGITDSHKLYIDGMFNGRGWTENYKVNKGQVLISNKLELRLPIVPGIIGVDAFFDAAAIKSSFQDLSSLSINDFYFSFGPGVRFLHPQFPLHLLFAWKFKTTDGVPSFDTNPFQFVLSFNITNN
ncbi:MAG: outer membrane protein assembly factor BamA [Treponema sp.]|nr:outer membrane protein assembly factor BamA [Treponema sp.]